MCGEDGEEAMGYGVLLYYKYTPPMEDLDALYRFYHSNCSSLSLLGRVRLSPHGVNVTVGGKLSALEKHISAVRENSFFHGTDFKLASCTQPLNDKLAEECGFTSLSIRIVKELVTLSSNPLFQLPPISNAGLHLSATDFHSIVTAAAAANGDLCEDGVPVDGTKLVLLDARNLYETRIGKFEIQNVETLDPAIRQYSDLHTWIDDNTEKLRGSHVLMYGNLHNWMSLLSPILLPMTYKERLLVSPVVDSLNLFSEEAKALVASQPGMIRVPPEFFMAIWTILSDLLFFCGFLVCLDILLKLVPVR